jgi:hypothetical protein
VLRAARLAPATVVAHLERWANYYAHLVIRTMKTALHWLIAAAAIVIASPVFAAKASEPGGPGEYRDFRVLKSYFTQDGGHTFRAFVIGWEGQEVVAKDAGSLIKARSDDTINVLISRGLPQGNRNLGSILFLARPERKPPGGVMLPASEGKSSSFHLKVKKVYSLASDYTFRAYEVEWMGSDVIVFDDGLGMNYQEGDTVHVAVRKMTYENYGKSHGVLTFNLRPSGSPISVRSK